MRVAGEVSLTDEERKTLTQWFCGRSTPARLVLRGKIILLAAEGRRNDEIAVELGTARKTVGPSRNRFVAQRLAGLEKDALRPGRSPKVRAAVAQQIFEATTQQRPKQATHWSTRSLAPHLGVSVSMVQRVRMANGLQPHRTKTFKLSNNKRFAEKPAGEAGEHNAIVNFACLRHQIINSLAMRIITFIFPALCRGRSSLLTCCQTLLPSRLSTTLSTRVLRC